MMTVIRQDDLIESVADALQYISYYHPVDFIQAMNAAYEREINPAAKPVLSLHFCAWAWTSSGKAI